LRNLQDYWGLDVTSCFEDSVCSRRGSDVNCRNRKLMFARVLEEFADVVAGKDASGDDVEDAHCVCEAALRR